MSSANWRPAAMLVGGALAAIGLLVFLLRPADPPAPPPITSAPVATTTAPPPPTVEEAAAPPPRPSASASQSNLIWNEDAGVYMLRLDNGELMPLPPGVTSASIAPPLPAEKPQTPEWKLEKTQRIFSLVGDRAKSVEKDAEALEKAGKKQEAAEKKILAMRLRKQMESMKAEMADYQKQIVADGGTFDGDVYFEAGPPK